MGQENQTQKTIEFNTVGRKTRPRDHIWAKTIYGIQHNGTGKSDPKDNRIQHSWQENQTQRPYMGKALYGQRPYMGFNTVGQENQTQKTIEFNTVGRKTRPRDHIWAKPYMGKDHYMGFNTVGQENQTQKTIEFNTVGRKTRPRDHIWAKTIYGIQHNGTGKSDPKDNRIQHSWQENQTQRPYMGKALYGQRPYMGFNTVGQENQTQKTIEFNTVGRKTRPETIYGQSHIWAKTIYGIQHSGTGKSDPKDDRIQHS